MFTLDVDMTKSMRLYMNDWCLGSAVLCYLYVKPWRLWRKFQSLKILIFPKILVMAVILMYQGDAERKVLLEMNVHFVPLLGICSCSVLTTTQLFLILKCYHKDIIFGSFHFSVDKQNKQAYGRNLAYWPSISLFKPHLNPTLVPSLTAQQHRPHFSLGLHLTWVAG